MGYCVRLLVPTDNEQELGPIIGRIAGHYPGGGVTIQEASGWWTNREGTLIKDKLLVLECSIGLWNEVEHDWWSYIADIVRAEWKQECVMFTVHHSDGYLIYGPESSSREEIGGTE